MNACFSIRHHLHPDSNVTEENDLQSGKQYSPKTSTKPVLQNAFSPIPDNLDSDSNIADESDPHFEKQFASKNATESEK
jgi:hypothetical protein